MQDSLVKSSDILYIKIKRVNLRYTIYIYSKLNYSQMNTDAIGVYIAVLILPLSFILEYFIGGTHYKFHPVNLIGSLVKFYENIFYSISNGIISGALFNLSSNLSIILIFGIFSFGYMLLSFSLADAGYFVYSASLYYVFNAILIYISASFISTGGLRSAAKKIFAYLSEGDIEKARDNLILLAGRDSKNLNEAEISRAAIESVAENLGDGVGSVLFFYGLFGIFGAIFYKTANTMDSIVGYRNEKYEKFGKCSAKLDDILNFIPFRITGLFMMLSILILQILERLRLSIFIFIGGLKIHALKNKDKIKSNNYHFKEAVKAYLMFKNSHPSPNGGQLESIMSGGLKIKLGGTNFYGGVKSERPHIGFDDYDIPSKDSIIQAVNIMTLSSIIAVIVYDFIFYLINIYFLNLAYLR